MMMEAIKHGKRVTFGHYINPTGEPRNQDNWVWIELTGTVETFAPKTGNYRIKGDDGKIYHCHSLSVEVVDILTDTELFARAKQQLTDLRATQAEIAKRHNARQAPAKAVCGHVARDHSGLCCDDELCPNYVPF